MEKFLDVNDIEVHSSENDANFLIGEGCIRPLRSRIYK